MKQNDRSSILKGCEEDNWLKQMERLQIQVPILAFDKRNIYHQIDKDG